MPAVSLAPRPVMAFETISVTSSPAVGPTLTTIVSNTTAATVSGADIIRVAAVEALCTVETAQIRLRIDGTAPTASVGHLFSAGDTFTVQGSQNVRNLLMIAVSSTASVVITYFS